MMMNLFMLSAYKMEDKEGNFYPSISNEGDDQAQINSSIMEEGRSIDKNRTTVGQSYCESRFNCGRCTLIS